MATIREEAQAYQPPQTLNIADLTAVPIDDLQVESRTGKKKNEDGTEETFDYKCVLVDGKEYRIPSSVLEKIQDIIKLRPEVKNVRVTRTGVGLTTRYKVDIIN